MTQKSQYPKGVNENSFLFKRHEEKPWTLINPIHQGVEWHGKMVWFRSRILHDDGRTVSCGFPKFFNLGERQDDKGVVKRLCKGKLPLLYSDKRDGSLLIRSVFEGEVIIRTRGAYGLGLEPVCVQQIYSCLPPEFLDGSWGEGMSFLFEFTSPDNRIVVPYDKPEVVLIGGIDHRKEPEILSFEKTEAIVKANSPDTKMVEQRSLEFNSIDDLKIWIDDQITEHPEGIVVNVNSRLIKVKNSDYLNKHRLKFYMKDKELRYICLRNAFRKSSDFAELAKELKIDWEIAKILEERYETYVDLVESCLSKIKAASSEASKFTSKKEAANQLKGSDLFPLIMAIMDGHVEKVHYWVIRQMELPTGCSTGDFKYDETMVNSMEKIGFKI